MWLLCTMGGEGTAARWGVAAMGGIGRRPIGGWDGLLIYVVLQAYRRRSEPSGRPSYPSHPSYTPARIPHRARRVYRHVGGFLTLLRRRLCPQISLYIGRYRTGRTGQALLHSVSSIRWQNSASYTPLPARPIPPWDGDALYPP